MMAVQSKIYTAQELERLPDDGNIYELHDGELITAAGSKRIQTLLAAWIVYLLGVFLQENQLGGGISTTDGTFTLDRYNTRIPDVAYLTEETLAKQPAENGFFLGAPDLAIEVISDSNTASEMRQRVGSYFRAGTRCIWLVYPDTKTVEIYQPDVEMITFKGDQELSAGDVLPKLKLSVSKIFQPWGKPL